MCLNVLKITEQSGFYLAEGFRGEAVIIYGRQ